MINKFFVGAAVVAVCALPSGTVAHAGQSLESVNPIPGVEEYLDHLDKHNDSAVGDRDLAPFVHRCRSSAD